MVFFVFWFFSFLNVMDSGKRMSAYLNISYLVNMNQSLDSHI